MTVNSGRSFHINVQRAGSPYRTMHLLSGDGRAKKPMSLCGHVWAWEPCDPDAAPLCAVCARVARWRYRNWKGA